MAYKVSSVFERPKTKQRKWQASVNKINYKIIDFKKITKIGYFYEYYLSNISVRRIKNG